MQGARGAPQEGGQRNRRQVLVAAGTDPCFEPLTAIIRGRAVESIHRGTVAVVDGHGTLLGGVGDPRLGVLLRSAAKPFQAAALVQSGAAEAFSLTDEEIAVVSASHGGAPEHVAVVRGLLERGGFSGASLVCGPVEHMCSGKHTGMLLLARHLGVAAEGYQLEEHPVQREVAGYIGSLLEACPRPLRPAVAAPPGEAPNAAASPEAGDASRALFAGTDGCGVPVVRTSLYGAAWLYASLVTGATPALARVRDAMIGHPVLVAGETRFDTRLMRAAPGRLVAKGGAEGVQGVGLLPGGAAPRADNGGFEAVGCFIKVEDGSARPIPSVVAVLLRAWGPTEAAAALEDDYPAGFVDSNGREVGRQEVLTETAALRRRRTPAPAGGRADDPLGEGVSRRGSLSPDSGPVAPPHSAGKDDRVTVCRGDEKDVLRFLRDQWPAVDEENFGRMVEWSAEPYALVFRRQKKIVAVLKGHFIGGIASVDEFMVGEGSRGSGLGSLLIGRFEDEARRTDCSRIILRAVKDSPAEDFYRARGYHRECVQYGYEFGYDYVRLARDVEEAPGAARGPGRERKGTS